MLRVYSKKDCQQCDQLKRLLAMREVEMEELKLGEDFQLEDIVKYNVRSFPVVFDDEKLIGSLVETIKYLAK